MIWFTADLHLGHTNIMRYCRRPFDCVEEMNSEIIQNALKVFSGGDRLFVLGDVSFDTVQAHRYLSAVKSMGVQIHYVLGNHDKGGILKAVKDECVKVCHMHHTRIDRQGLSLCHYAMRTWKGSHRGAWNLHGHSHGNLEPVGKQLDVGVDNHQYKPVAWPDVQQIIGQYPDVNIDHHEGNR